MAVATDITRPAAMDGGRMGSKDNAAGAAEEGVLGGHAVQASRFVAILQAEDH